MTSHGQPARARRRLLRLTGLGFVVGSALFAVGVPLSLDASLPPTVGTVLFFAGACTVAATDGLLSSWWSNAGTFAGALCFLVGAVLLLPRAPVPEAPSRLA